MDELGEVGMVLLAISTLTSSNHGARDRYLAPSFDTKQEVSATFVDARLLIFGHTRNDVLIIPCFALASEIIRYFHASRFSDYPSWSAPPFDRFVV